MRDYNTIWHIELYDEYGKRVSEEFFAREKAARQYIETWKDMWRHDNLDWSIGGEILWL